MINALIIDVQQETDATTKLMMESLQSVELQVKQIEAGGRVLREIVQKVYHSEINTEEIKEYFLQVEEK
ncbi:MAG: hypothetical protein ACI35P_05340 [Bacillus sp. (in: firmicutes)]